MSQERHGAVKFREMPLTVRGPVIEVGDDAPNFRLQAANDMRQYTIDDWQNKVRIISVVPSIDTRVCQTQTRRFNEEATALNEDVVVLTVSVDLPAAQRRWCAAEGIERVQMLSDHYDMNFGDRYGTHIKEWRMEQRSVFVIDRDGTVVHAEYVPTIGEEPNYEAALDAARQAAANSA